MKADGTFWGCEKYMWKSWTELAGVFCIVYNEHCENNIEISNVLRTFNFFV